MNLKIYTKFWLIVAMLFNGQNLCSAIGLTNAGAHHVIGLRYKKDCILSFGGMIVGDDYSKLTLQTGFAYHNFLAFQIGYQYSSDDPYFTINRGIAFKENANDHFAHVSIGAFYPIPIKNSKWRGIWKKNSKWFRPRHILLDAYLTYGKGFNNRLLEPTDMSLILLPNGINSKSTINFNKWYMQGGLHYQGHILGAGITGMFGVLNFRKIAIHGIPENALLNLANLLKEDATYYTYGYQFKVSLCFDAFTILYHNHQNFIINQDELNLGLFNYFGEVSIQVNIGKLFTKKVHE